MLNVKHGWAVQIMFQYALCGVIIDIDLIQFGAHCSGTRVGEQMPMFNSKVVSRNFGAFEHHRAGEH